MIPAAARTFDLGVVVMGADVEEGATGMAVGDWAATGVGVSMGVEEGISTGEGVVMGELESTGRGATSDLLMGVGVGIQRVLVTETETEVDESSVGSIASFAALAKVGVAATGSDATQQVSYSYYIPNLDTYRREYQQRSRTRPQKGLSNYCRSQD